ncbi:MAG: response regulator [Verrucomicrobiota bacterium]
MSMLNLLLVDDHVIVRSGVAAYIEAEEDMRVVAEAGSVEEAKAQLAATKGIDVVVVDLRLPDGSGIDVLQVLSETYPGVKALTLSVNAGENDVFAAVEAGACGYLSKSAEREEILDAIRLIAAGETYFPASIKRKLDQGRARPKLTERERAILEAITKGQSNKEIASTLNIAEITARQHVSSMLRKLGAQDRTQAAVQALREGHVSIPE